MGLGRRQYTDEFKREAVGLLASSGRPLLQIAKELGISASMLRNWRGYCAGSPAETATRRSPTATRLAHRTRSAPATRPDKTELVHHGEYPNRDAARRDLFAYVEGYYNRQRRHSRIGYITPEKAEAKAA